MAVPYKGVPVFNPDGTFRKEDDIVQGRSFSSNLTKMLKHMDKLEAIQQGKPPSPVRHTSHLQMHVISHVHSVVLQTVIYQKRCQQKQF